jgi:hypothetical protein
LAQVTLEKDEVI